MEMFGFALAVTGPTFLWVLLGLVVNRIGWFTEDLNRISSLVVFRVGLPVVLFFGAARVNYLQISHASYLVAGMVATLAVVLLAEFYGRLRRVERGDRAVFVQAAYRSNLGVIGIALAAEAYGSEGLALAALPVALMTVLYNLIAVPLLDYGYGRKLSPGNLLRGIVTNPLIVAIAAGILVSLLGLPLSYGFKRLGVSLSAVMIPLALVCIGASMDLRALRGSRRLTVDATVWRLLLAPLVGVSIALMLGVHGAELAVLFLLLASPAAAASYIMVAAVGGNTALAANIVVISTLFSSLSITLGLATLQWAGLV